MNIKEKNILGLVQILTAYFLAGSSIVAGRFLSGRIPVNLIVGISLTLGLLCMLPLQIQRRKELLLIDKRELALMFLQALSGIVLTRFFTMKGLGYITASGAAVINAATPVLMALSGVIFWNESFRWSHFTGLILLVGGISLLNREGFTDPASVTGFLFILGAVLGEVGMNSFRKMSRKKISSVTNTTVLFFMSLIMFLPFVMKELPVIHTLQTADILVLFYYGAGGSALAYIFWGAGVMKVTSIQAGVCSSMIPLSALLLSLLLLKESLTPVQSTGALLALLGMVVSGRKEGRFLMGRARDNM